MEAMKQSTCLHQALDIKSTPCGSIINVGLSNVQLGHIILVLVVYKTTMSMKMYTRSCVNAIIVEGNVHNNHVNEG